MPVKDYASYSDVELAALLKRHDQGAFTEIYNRYWSVLYLHARHMLHQQDLATDVIQEVFTKLWDKSEELEFTVGLNAYLYRSVRNTILNMIRREKVEAGYLTELGHFFQEGTYDTEEQLNFNELSRLIEAEIELLPPKMREVFVLSRKFNLSHASIAEQLNISDQTVKKQINKALHILRLKLNLPPMIILLFL